MESILYYNEYISCMKKKDIGNEFKCKDILIKLLNHIKKIDNYSHEINKTTRG